jgi:acetylglutamate kinase
MQPAVIKVGGSTLGNHDTALEDIAALAREGRKLVVVHGGGNAATDWLSRHGVASEFVDGLRVTGPEAIEVVTAVFAGLVNKQIVAGLQALGVAAIGISGVDGGLLATRQSRPDLGFVGEVTRVDRQLLDAILGAGYLPVVASLGFWEDQPAQLMNINADTVAGEIAAALEAEDLVLLTDVASVLDGDGAPLSELDAGQAEDLIAAGVASRGMIPKLRACVRAASAGVRCHIVDGREASALKTALAGSRQGTLVTAGRE